MIPEQQQDRDSPTLPLAEHLQPAVLTSTAMTAGVKQVSPYLLPGAIVAGMTMLGLFYFLASLYRPTAPAVASPTQAAPPNMEKKQAEPDDDEVHDPKAETPSVASTSLRDMVKRVTAERSEAAAQALKNPQELADFDEMWAARFGWGDRGADDITPSAFLVWYGDKKFKRPSNYNHMWALGGELGRIRLRLLELGKSNGGVSIGRGAFDYYGNYAVYLAGYINPFKSGDVVDLYGYITDLHQYETIEKKQRSIPGFAVLAAVKVGTAEKARAAYLTALREVEAESPAPEAEPKPLQSAGTPAP